MPYWIFVNPDNLSLGRMYLEESAEAVREINVNDPLVQNHHIIQIPDHLTPGFIKAVRDANGEIVLEDDPEAYVESLRLKVEYIRRERNQLLAQSDWMMLPDVTMSDTSREQWKTYRQALRDMPSQFSTLDDLHKEIVWPTAPSS